MPRYTFYRFTAEGVTVGTSHYECQSDEAALAHAMENAGRCAIEIWRGDEKIGHVDGGLSGLHEVTRGLGIPDCDPEETGTARHR